MTSPELAEEVLEGDMDLFDNWARLVIHQRASPALTLFMGLVTWLGSASFLLTLGACTVLASMTKKRSPWGRADTADSGSMCLNVALIHGPQARKRSATDWSVMDS